MEDKIYSIILAGGKGTRMQSKDINKVALKLNGKELINYALDLFGPFVSRQIVVIGAFKESVKAVINDSNVSFANQKIPLGTGHAGMVAVRYILRNLEQPSYVFLGYGDHLMHYKSEDLTAMINFHKKEKNSLTLISTEFSEPNFLSWGRIVRNNKGKLIKIKEQKEASIEELKISELNAGFYLFNFRELAENIFALKKAKIQKEYLLTDIVSLFLKKDLKVETFKIPFEHIGFGVNTPEQFAKAEELLKANL